MFVMVEVQVADIKNIELIGRQRSGRGRGKGAAREGEAQEDQEQKAKAWRDKTVLICKIFASVAQIL